jgi:hypothetical protein
MKNIFLIPTPDETRVAIKSDGLLFLTNHPYPNSPKFVNHHIYITSDEEIKEGDWVIQKSTGKFMFLAFTRSKSYNKNKDLNEEFSKIILTTDQDLINDGVQKIDDEFLEWFVDNQTCEEIEVESFCKYGDNCPSEGAYDKQHLCDVGYKLIIPKQLEEYCHYSGLPSPAAYVEKPSEEELRKMFSNAFNIPQEYHGQEDKPNVIIVGSGIPPAKLSLELTQKEARALLNCLSRTFAKGTDLDFTEPIEEKLLEFLKPLEK